MQGGRIAFVLLTIGAALAPLSGAIAQGRVRGALELAAPRECISDAELRAGIVEILGRPVWIDRSEAEFILRATIEAGAGSEWSIQIELIDRYERVIGRRHANRTGGSCRSLDRMLAVIMAMVIDLPELETSLRLPPPEPAQPVTPSLREANSPLEVRGDRRFEVRVAVGGTLSIGLVPDIGVGAVLALALRPDVDWPALFIEGRMLAPSDQAELGRGATFTLIDTHVGVCPEFDVEVVRLGGCLDLGAGALLVTPFGFAGGGASFASPIVTARARAVGALLLRPVEVRLAAGLELPLVHERFVRDAGTSAQATIHQMESVAFFTSVQVGLVTDP